MKKFIYASCAILLLSLNSSFLPFASAQGSQGGNGGDIRRHRAASALQYFVRALQELSEIPANCSISVSNPELRSNSLALFQWANRMRIRWVDQNPGSCLAFFKSNGQITLNFSYAHCPLPTPPHFYTQAIADAFLKSFIPQQKPDRALKDLGLILEESRAKGCTIPRGDKKLPLNRYLPQAFSDPSRAVTLLEAGRALALKLIESSSQNFSAPVKNFMDRNRVEFAQDLRTSTLKVEAHHGAQSCALTQLARQAPIFFSVKYCTDFQSDLDIAWTLLHETVHHFGIEAENFADRVASEIIWSAPL